LYHSDTTTNVPTTIVSGELAANTVDGKLFLGTGTNTYKTLLNVGSSTVTVGGNLTFSGAFSTTLTVTGTTTGTLPTSGYHISTVTNMAANPVTGTPSSSNFLRGDGTWATITATSPGGSNTQVQYNSSGSFAGSANLVFDGTNLTSGGYKFFYNTGLYTTDGTISNYSSSNYVFLTGNAGGGINIAGDGTNRSQVINITGGASGYMNFNTSSTERMRIDSSGNVGIGTSSPSYKLSVVNTSGVTCNLEKSTGASLQFTAGGTTEAQIAGNGAGALLFFTGSTLSEKMRLSSAGGLSVGTSADAGAGGIYATANITAYYSSDIKFKENVQDVPDALGIVTAIGSKTFDWTDEYLADHGGEDEYFQPKQSFGVIAQDVQKVFPQAVRTRTDGSLAVDYEKLAILSFGAIGQLLKRVEALEAK